MRLHGDNLCGWKGVWVINILKLVQLIISWPKSSSTLTLFIYCWPTLQTIWGSILRWLFLEVSEQTFEFFGSILGIHNNCFITGKYNEVLHTFSLNVDIVLPHNDNDTTVPSMENIPIFTTIRPECQHTTFAERYWNNFRHQLYSSCYIPYTFQRSYANQTNLR